MSPGGKGGSQPDDLGMKSPIMKLSHPKDVVHDVQQLSDTGYLGLIFALKAVETSKGGFKHRDERLLNARKLAFQVII